jgi:NADH:ubiquinone oxidoreductase subunit E
MAIRLPPFPNFNKLEGILEFIANPEKASAFLEQLRKYRDEIDASIAVFGEAQEMKGMLSQARSDREVASRELEKAKSHASERVEAADERFKAREDSLVEGETLLDEARQELDTLISGFRDASAKRTEALDGRESKLAVDQSAALAALDDAQKMKALYEARLSTIQGAIGEAEARVDA